jgi:hypothetical protein
MDKKICPLKILEYDEETQDYKGMPCVKENCAWWCKIQGKCAIYVIATKGV